MTRQAECTSMIRFRSSFDALLSHILFPSLTPQISFRVCLFVCLLACQRFFVVRMCDYQINRNMLATDYTYDYDMLV